MPVDQTDHITFRPIAIARSTWNATIQGSIAGTFITALSSLDVLQIIKSIFRMTTGMAVTSPLYMQEVFYLLHLLFRDRFIIGKDPPIPTSPDRRRIYIYNIATECTTANCCLTFGIKMMCQCIQLTHQAPYLTLFKFRKVIRPVILITQSPDYH